MITCPICKAEIDNDSFFCDQCGTELYFCPNCKKPSKGKRCTQCGTVLVKASELSIMTTAAAATQSTMIPSQQNNQQPQFNTQPQQPQFNQPQPQQPQFNAQPQFNQPQPASTPPAGESTCRPGMAPPSAQPSAVRWIDNEGHVVDLKDGAIIGRKTGDYLSVFSSNGYVSGTHARLSFNPASRQWSLTDLGSTNGSQINGTPLTPNIPTEFHIGDTVMIAMMVFRVM